MTPLHLQWVKVGDERRVYEASMGEVMYQAVYWPTSLGGIARGWRVGIYTTVHGLDHMCVSSDSFASDKDDKEDDEPDIHLVLHHAEALLQKLYPLEYIVMAAKG
jgi:hypothetical protein